LNLLKKYFHSSVIAVILSPFILSLHITNANSATSITLSATGQTPYGISIDSAGNIYTANYGDNTVTKITPAGVPTTLGPTGNGPSAITIDSAGNIYTANRLSRTVTKITPAGVLTTLGSTGNAPWGITVDSAGNVYTTNLGNDNVTKITPLGSSSTLGTTGGEWQSVWWEIDKTPSHKVFLHHGLCGKEGVQNCVDYS
jgi:sugar lactone lactonase YvrE